MSNGRQDDSVHFKEEENELRTETGACLLVTIFKSKEREKGSNNDSESSLERETEVGMEMEMEMEVETAFSFIGAVFSVRRTGDSIFLWEGGITVFKDMTGMDRLCSEGPGQDDEGQGGNAAPRTK
jgi:hypothetical protein